MLCIYVTVCNFVLEISSRLGFGDPGSPESKRERRLRIIFATVTKKSMLRGGRGLVWDGLGVLDGLDGFG